MRTGIPEHPIPVELPNWIDGEQRLALCRELFDKLNPANGQLLCRVARSRTGDIDQAVIVARKMHAVWAQFTPVKRGAILHEVAMGLKERREEVARIVTLETGKSPA